MLNFPLVGMNRLNKTDCFLIKKVLSISEGSAFFRLFCGYSSCGFNSESSNWARMTPFTTPVYAFAHPSIDLFHSISQNCDMMRRDLFPLNKMAPR